MSGSKRSLLLAVERAMVVGLQRGIQQVFFAMYRVWQRLCESGLQTSAGSGYNR